MGGVTFTPLNHLDQVYTITRACIGIKACLLSFLSAALRFFEPLVKLHPLTGPAHTCV